MFRKKDTWAAFLFAAREEAAIQRCWGSSIRKGPQSGLFQTPPPPEQTTSRKLIPPPTYSQKEGILSQEKMVGSWEVGRGVSRAYPSADPSPCRYPLMDMMMSGQKSIFRESRRRRFSRNKLYWEHTTQTRYIRNRQLTTPGELCPPACNLHK